MWARSRAQSQSLTLPVAECVSQRFTTELRAKPSPSHVKETLQQRSVCMQEVAFRNIALLTGSAGILPATREGAKRVIQCCRRLTRCGLLAVLRAITVWSQSLT